MWWWCFHGLQWLQMRLQIGLHVSSFCFPNTQLVLRLIFSFYWWLASLFSWVECANNCSAQGQWPAEHPTLTHTMLVRFYQISGPATQGGFLPAWKDVRAAQHRAVQTASQSGETHTINAPAPLSVRVTRSVTRDDVRVPARWSCGGTDAVCICNILFRRTSQIRTSCFLSFKYVLWLILMSLLYNIPLSTYVPVFFAEFTTGWLFVVSVSVNAPKSPNEAIEKISSFLTGVGS